MWYAASLLFKGSRVPAGADAPLWQESIRLIGANTDDEARAKAEKIGQAERVSYQVSGGTLTWVFDRIERVYTIEVDVLADGTEVFSRFLRDTEVASLLTPFEDD
jgi:hypothetical protein